jgi:DNA polymerase III delta prime subunit
MIVGLSNFAASAANAVGISSLVSSVMYYGDKYIVEPCKERVIPKLRLGINDQYKNITGSPLFSGDFSITIFSDQNPTEFKAIIKYIATERNLADQLRYCSLIQDNELLCSVPGFEINQLKITANKVQYQIVVERKRLDSTGSVPIEQLKLKLITPDESEIKLDEKNVLNSFITQAVKQYYKPLMDHIQIWRLAGGRDNWEPMNSLEFKRPLSSIILHQDNVERIQLQLDRFLEGNIDRLVYLFHGAPGTGKSSLATAIATLLKEHYKSHKCGNIYTLSLSTPGLSDTTLPLILNKIEPYNVLLLEDIEMLKVNEARGLLSEAAWTNVMDGVGVPIRKLVIVMTTNKPQLLTDRMTRAGRVHLVQEITLPTEKQAKRYIHYYSTTLLRAELNSLAKTLCKPSICTLQELFKTKALKQKLDKSNEQFIALFTVECRKFLQEMFTIQYPLNMAALEATLLYVDYVMRKMYTENVSGAEFAVSSEDYTEFKTLYEFFTKPLDKISLNSALKTEFSNLKKTNWFIYCNKDAFEKWKLAVPVPDSTTAAGTTTSNH